MRFLQIGSPCGQVSVKVPEDDSSEVSSFTIQLISQAGGLRLRTVQFGGAVAVVLRYGELDDVDGDDNGGGGFGTASSSGNAANNDDDKPSPLYIIVGSDEGLTEITLLRIAALVHEMGFFLNLKSPVPSKPARQQNILYIRLFLAYVHARMGENDLGFLSQAIEPVFNPGITATGFSSNQKLLLEDLVRLHVFDHDETDYDESAQVSPQQNPTISSGSQQQGIGFRLPGYVAVLLGHKLVLETTPQLTEDANRYFDLQPYCMLHSDRYLVYLLTCAVFAVPHRTPSPSEVIDTDAPANEVWDDIDRYANNPQMVLKMEKFLSEKLGIHRGNVTREGCRDAIEEYCAALRYTDEGKTAEAEKASFYELCFQVVLRSVQPEQQTSQPRVVLPKNQYHEPGVDLVYLSENVFDVGTCSLRDREYPGSLQFVWIDGGVEDSSDAEERQLSAKCPKGYGMCLVYFPPRDEKEAKKLENNTSLAGYFTLAPERALRNLSRAVLGSVEITFNQLQWLLSPPVESYETPGLIHFVAVDRRDNHCVCGSFERMMHTKSSQVCAAVKELQITMMQCMSKAHELVSYGFTEGLWGHLGMQFFFTICTAPVSDSPAGGSVSSPGPNSAKAALSASGKNNGGNPSNAESTGTAFGGIFGATEGSRKIPSNVVGKMTLRPMQVPDLLGENSKQTRVIEIYALFIGCMSPAEVCHSVDWLRSSRLFN